MARSILHRYEDPLDALWLECARRVGLRVERIADAYASTDGRGTLFLSDSSGMDADDCLAQMIFHELCHALIQGPASFQWIDWGLDNESNRDDTLEHACLRLQAALLEPLGLRQVLGPTTDFRQFYDELPADPFEERTPTDRESIVRARAAWSQHDAPPFGPHLRASLDATAQILGALRPFSAPRTDIADADARPSLYVELRPPAELHPLGFPLHPSPHAERNCSHCAWATPTKRTNTVRCRPAKNRATRADSPACERFEAQLDCLDCGACCREAYDVVSVGRRDPASKLHLTLLKPHGSSFDLIRERGRCLALRGGAELPPILPAILTGREGHEADDPRRAPRYVPSEIPFTCSIYETRPRTCRDFTRGSQNCLEARRVVGLSR